MAVAWTCLSRVLPPVIAPSLVDIAQAASGYVQEPSFYKALWSTFTTFFVAILLSILVSAVISYLSCWQAPFAGLLAPLVSLLNAVPGISWLGLAIIWFGIGSGPTRFLVIVSTAPILIAALNQAYADRNPRFDELRLVFRVPLRTYLQRIMIPQLAGPALAAVQAMIGLGWKLTIMGEFLSSSAGLGRLLFDAKSNFQTDRVIALTLLTVLTWGLINLAFRVLRHLALPVDSHGYSRETPVNA